uniref:AP-3 complex subunit beta n=1 Tax=Albugo laibachii Nc14 TaxID=890382 RepID=F0WA97_9STRA|nr:AP3 complex subunit beta putative [Albugo laibachii Nc14]|eukprot:CCA18067.1 AP3 complex subunit beta putative [Albugo laibachii Nc14]
MALAMRGISGDAHFFEEAMNMDRIRKLLDSKLGVSGHSEKLEAMKSLLASISKGEDVSIFFPDVVKNVIVASVEVKKLVYMYLVHYADVNTQCRELALLSINSFQKDLADPNQLIRALALRVMTNIRVREILQIQLIAIRKCASDVSPYVRKCAANAISKVFVLDPDQSDVLAEIIGQLLNDHSTMVLGSAMQALNEVCSNRLDLLHAPFRKICHLLADIDEWGQIIAVNVLTRYCREQFQHFKVSKDQKDQMNKKSFERNGFYSDEEDGLETHRKHGRAQVSRSMNLDLGSTDQDLDEDHRLLLRSSMPLLKSRNSAAVLAVATLHFYCGTNSMATITLIAKSLVRIMRNQREIQFVVLSVISSMALARPEMFAPFLQDFFVRATDASYTRRFKLEILTSLVTEENVSVILREFQAYVRHVDKKFVTMTIKALGRVAVAIPSVTERCLSGLLRLVRSSAENVVAQSVIVIRLLLQKKNPEDMVRVVRSLAAMLMADRVTAPSARASIVWMLGEFMSRDKHGFACSAEMLRLLVKRFIEETTEVRLQILNFAVKFSVQAREDRNVQLLRQYVLELCKFDNDYDVRDRARLMRAILSSGGEVMDAQKLFAGKRPAPSIALKPDSNHYTFGTLSSLIKHEAPGYRPLPKWRTQTPDNSLRDEQKELKPEPEFKQPHHVEKPSSNRVSGGFYSDNSSFSSQEDDNDASEASSSESSDESGSFGSHQHNSDIASDSDSASESSDDSAEESGRNVTKGHGRVSNTLIAPHDAHTREATLPDLSIAADYQAKNPLDVFDPLRNRNSSRPDPFLSAGDSTVDDTSSLWNGLMNLSMTSASCEVVPAKYVLLSKVNGSDLKITYAYLRQPSMYSSSMNLIQLWLQNDSDAAASRVKVIESEYSDTEERRMVTFDEVPVIFPGGAPFLAQLHIDFRNRLEAIPLQVSISEKQYDVQLQVMVGELLSPTPMSLEEFERHVLLADQDTLQSFDLQLPNQDTDTDIVSVVHDAVLQCCNLFTVSRMHDQQTIRFAGCWRGEHTPNAQNSRAQLLLKLQISSTDAKALVMTGQHATQIITGIRETVASILASR